jgi:hypothetical protein
MKLHRYGIAVLTLWALGCAPAGAASGGEKQRDEDSVYRWGRWAVLAPAAGLEAPLQVADTRLPDPPQPDPPTPFICAPGAACGYATIAAGITGSGAAQLGSFNLRRDARGFRVRAGEPGSITSIPMSATQLNDYLSAHGNDGNADSRVAARVFEGGQASGDLSSVSGFWRQVDGDAESASSGFFAWGIATPQADLDALNNGNAVVEFDGAMASSATDFGVRINFGPRASWSGAWSGAHNFSADGDLRGVDLVTNRFSNNVAASGSLEGVLLGRQGNQAVAVELDAVIDGTPYADVGMAPQR